MLGRELRDARIGSGLSQTAVARAAGVSHATVSRVELGRASSANLVVLARIASVLGLDLSARVYPVGPPVRDAAHLALVARFTARLHRSSHVRTEVPLPGTNDPRAWDMVIFGAGPPIAVEAETRLGDMQALERRLALKQRDSGLERVLIVVADTRGNRVVLRTVGAPTGYPRRSRAVLAALAEARDPGASATVVT
jgi:transcriptional regulator with XRE-family HTH domain